MATVLLVLHLMIALGLIGVVLMQRSEGGGLGMGGGGGGGFMSGRGTANLLTRATAGLAAAFFCTSIALTLLAKSGSKTASPLDSLPRLAPISAPATPGPAGTAPAGTTTAPAPTSTPANAPAATPGPAPEAPKAAAPDPSKGAPPPKSQ